MPNLTPEDIDEIARRIKAGCIDLLMNGLVPALVQDGRSWGMRELTPAEIVAQGAIDAQSGQLDALGVVGKKMQDQRLKELADAARKVG